MYKLNTNIRTLLYQFCTKTKMIYILFLCLFLVSCKTQQSVTDTQKEVRIVDHDTTIIIQPDSASVMALFECDSMNNVIVKQLQNNNGERIETQIIYVPTNNGGLSLKVDCKEDSLQKIIQWQDSLITIKTTTTTTEYVRRRNGYDKFVSCGFWILLSAMLVYVALKIYFR